MNLIDWRDKYFDKAEDTTGDDGKKYNFYGFYGVTKVAADIVIIEFTIIANLQSSKYIGCRFIFTEIQFYILRYRR